MLKRAWDARLTERGVALMEDPDKRWELVSSGYRELEAAQGKFHVYIDCVDGAGNRIIGVPVRFFWGGGMDDRVTEAKPGEPFALSWPLYASGSGYSFMVEDGPIVHGLGLGSISHQDMGESVCFEFVFQRRSAGGSAGPEAPVPHVPDAVFG